MTRIKLVETQKCPVCGSSEREPSDGMARGRQRDLQGVYYLKPAAAALGISLDDLVECARTYRCLSCRNYYCDPWFSPELAASLFCAEAPDHLFAWGHFENWLHRRPAARTPTQMLFAAVTRRIGPIAFYGEFGCPFQGFLLQMRGAEAAPSERISLFARALGREPDVRWSRITRLYNAAQRWCGRLAVLSLRVRGVLVRLASLKNRQNGSGRGDGQDAYAEIHAPSLPHRRYLLTQDTTMGWGSNCVRYGASCRYFAHTVLDADVIPISEADRTGLPRFDLIGIFNSLDHTTFPMALIRRCLALTDHVLIVTHHAALAGKQHWFAFSDEFVAWLAKSLEGITAESLHEEVDGGGRDENYILLSRKTAGATRPQGTNLATTLQGSP